MNLQLLLIPLNKIFLLVYLCTDITYNKYKERGEIIMRNKKGFTLIEIIIVLVIIGIIGAITFPAFASLLKDSAENNCRSSREKIQRKLESTLVLDEPSDINEAVENVLFMHNGTLVTTIMPNKMMQYKDVCEDGGVYTITINDDHTATITCSIHP